MRFKFRQKKITAPSVVVLRDIEDAEGTRLLEAFLSSDGDILIKGRDYGDGVEKILGMREYESGNDAADLGEFLDAHGIATEKWSRLGD